MLSHTHLGIREIITEAIMERIVGRIQVKGDSPASTIAEETSHMAIDDDSTARAANTCCKPSHTKQQSAVAFLLESHKRIIKEEKHFPKVWSPVTHSQRLKMNIEENKTVKSYFSCSFLSLLHFWVVLEPFCFLFFNFLLRVVRWRKLRKKPGTVPKPLRNREEPTTNNWSMI